MLILFAGHTIKHTPLPQQNIWYISLRHNFLRLIVR